MQSMGRMPARLRAIGLSAALLTALSGCLSSTMDRMGALLGASGGVRSMVLRDGVALDLPRGICLDPEHSKPSRGFALIAACDRFGDGARRGAPVFATVQLSGADSASVAGQEETFAALLLGDGGQALLRGDAITDTDIGSNMVAVQTGGSDAPVWRGFADHASVLVVVTVRPLPGLEANERATRRLLDQVLGGIRP